MAPLTSSWELQKAKERKGFVKTEYRKKKNDYFRLGSGSYHRNYQTCRGMGHGTNPPQTCGLLDRRMGRLGNPSAACL